MMTRFDATVFLLATIYLLARAPDPVFFLESTDQGYQMALGVTLLNGGIPGVDVYTQYGPLVAVASAIGWLAPGVTGEVAICALGYAAAISLAAAVLRPRVGPVAAGMATLGLLLLFPRFYKWYYWLLPVMGLALALGYRAACDDFRPVRTRLIAWGLFCAVAGLFRYDLGIFSVIFGVAAIAVVRGGSWNRVTLFLAAALVLPTAAVLLVSATRGIPGLTMSFQAIVDGTRDSVDAYGIPPFSFDPARPVSAANALAALQVLMPLVAGGALILGWWESRVEPGYALFCSALAALGILPQALHRADPQHLLQVLPPFVLTMALLIARVPWVGATLPIFVGLLLVQPGIAADLSPVARNPVAYWQALAALPESRSKNDIADMAMVIQKFVPAGATIFPLLPLTPTPLLYFSGHRLPGLFPLYEPGMFSSSFWLNRNRIALKRMPPDFVIAAQAASSDLPAPFLPDIISDWEAGCTSRIHANARFILFQCNLQPVAD